MNAIVGYTIAETLRRRILWVLFVVTLIVIGVTPLGVARLVDLASNAGADSNAAEALVAQGLIFIAFQTSFVLALTAGFLGAPAISSEIASGAAAVMLTRPILRSTYLIGRWVGLAIVIIVEAAVVGSLSLGVTYLATGYAPPIPALPVIFLAAQALVVLTFTLLLSCRFTPAIAGSMALLAYAIAWLGGVLASVGGADGVTGAEVLGRLTQLAFPTDVLWRGILFGLEPPNLLALSGGVAGNPFYVDAPPDAYLLVWSAFWVLFVVWQGIAFLRRREL